MTTVLILTVSLFSLVLTVLPTNIIASTLYVGGGGPGNYTMIQDAINASMPGNTIMVYNGTYSEHLTVDKTISIVGENVNTTTIIGDGLTATIYINANWVNISGFSLTVLPSFIEPGIALYSVHNCSITDNNISDVSVGIALQYADNVTIEDNDISSYGEGIQLYKSSDGKIANNTISSIAGNGMEILESPRQSITDNEISNSKYAGILISIYSDRSFIANNTLISNGRGAVTLEGVENQTLSRNLMIGNGIFMAGWTIGQWTNHSIDVSNTVNGKPVYYWRNANGGTIPSGAGQVILANCTNVAVDGQDVSNSSIGITLGFSSWNALTDNIARGGQYGAMLMYSTHNTFDNLVATDNDYGAFVGSPSSNNIFVNSDLSRNLVTGLYFSTFSNDNTVTDNVMSLNGNYGIEAQISNGNTIAGNTVMSNHIGGMQLWGHNYTITDNAISSNNYSGIYLLGSDDSFILRNTIHSNGEYGISMKSTDRTAVANNTVYNNKDGLHITTSHENAVRDNNISSNSIYGIYLYNSRNNTITGNNIEYNQCGAYVWSSYDNRIHHNHFVNNTNQSIDGGINLWDDGYPSGGNYWSDYAGADRYSGPGQNITICDGKGDTPYDIPGGSNQDRYPLTFCIPMPWIPLNDPPTVNLTAPAQGEIVSGEYTIMGTASDPENALQIVEIKIDEGQWTEVIGNTSWTFYWDTTKVDNGIHTIHVRSFDGVYYSIDVFVNVTVSNPISDGQDDWLFVLVTVSVIAIAVVVMIAYILFRRRRRPLEAEASAEESSDIEVDV